MAKEKSNTLKYHLPLSLPIKFNKEKKYGSTLRILYTGGFWWQPNLEGIIWFFYKVYPFLKNSINNGDIHIDIIGANVPEKIKLFDNEKNIKIHGFVENIEYYFNHAHICIVPILSGSGIRVKAIESLSYGIPIVSTNKGCEGIGLTNKFNSYITDDPIEFSQVLLFLSKNKEELIRITHNAQEFYINNFSINKVKKLKSNIYDFLLNKNCKSNKS